MPLSDLFTATEQEARAVTSVSVPRSTYPGADLKGTDIIKLSAICNLLDGGTGSANWDEKAIPSLAALSEDGPWIYEIRGTFFDRLCGLSDANNSDYAKRWAKLFYSKFDRFDELRAAESLTTLRRVANEARSSGKLLFSWESL